MREEALPLKNRLAYRLIFASLILITIILVLSSVPDMFSIFLNNLSKVFLLKGIQASHSNEYLLFQDTSRYMPQNGRPFFDRSLKLADVADTYGLREATSVTTGLALLNIGDYEGAVDILERTTALSPDDRLAKFWLGVALENAGQEDMAYTLWGESGFLGHVVQRALSLYQQKRYSDVEAVVLRVVKICSSSACRESELAKLWETLGRAYREQQRYSEAVVAYTAALNYLQLPQYFEGLALSHMGNDDDERAIDVLLRLADEAPKNAAYQIWLGRSYADLGRYAEAEERLLRGLSLSKGRDEWGYHELARYYESRKRYDDADRVMYMLIHEIPQSVCSQLRIWQLSLASSNRQSAIFEDALRRYQGGCLDADAP